MLQIDKKDKILLKELDWNARQSNTELSKKLRLSPKSVEYRLSQLMKKGILLGFYPVVDFMRLGYQYNRVLIRLQYLSASVRKEIESYVQGERCINWALWFEGDYDLGLAFWTKSSTDFTNNLLRFTMRFNKHIKEVLHSVVICLHHYPYPFEDKKAIQSYSMSEVQQPSSIDKTDNDILQCLQKDARATSTSIASALDLNYKLVSYRIKRLEKEGILLSTRAKIDHIALGLIHYKVFTYLNYTSESELKRFKQKIASLTDTAYIVEQTNVSFFDFELIVNSERELFDILNGLTDLFSNLIREYRYFSFGKTIKMSFVP